ncbi:MAG TPA: efflux RND transporter periplasmic adaptor subunit [Kofleriaceae bacterium]|jgi:RND family efflux transporter MFP subunit
MKTRAMIALLGFVACSHSAPDAGEDDKPAPAAVTCKVVTDAPVDDVVSLTGVIAPPPRLDATLSPPASGRVAMLAVEEGDHVAAGALLATIDDPALPAGAIEARATVAAAQAAQVAATQELERQKRLVDKGIGAKRDLEAASAKMVAAKAELDAANARSGLAHTANARRELRAPFAGVVLHVFKRAGESVDGTTATPVVEIADTSTLEVRAQLPSSALIGVREGMIARVELPGVTAPLTAKVARVAPAVDPATLLQTVRITIDGAEGVAVGSPATASITLATRPGFIVPSTAIRRSLVGTDEIVVCDGDTARVRVVEVRPRDALSSEILSGLKSGEKIVVDHPLGLEDGQALTTPGAATTKGSADVTVKSTQDDELAGAH